MPCSVLRTKREIAMRAPVLPAEIAAWASPLFTKSTATRMDESFLPRNALATASSMPTTSLAARKDTRGPNSAVMRSYKGRKSSSRPTSMAAQSASCRRNSEIAGRMTDGPWSPPMQSTARVIAIFLGVPTQKTAGCVFRIRPFQRLGLFAFVLDDLFPPIHTGRGNVVTQMHFTRGCFHRERWIGQKVVRTMHTALRRGFFVLLNCHVTTPCSMLP